MRIYFLDVTLEVVFAEVLFNGFPVSTSPTGAKRVTVQVNQYVVAGPNALAVEVASGAPDHPAAGTPPPPGGPPHPLPPAARVEVALCACVDQRFPGEGPFDVLARVPGLVPAPPPPPFRQTAVADLAPDLPRWRWQDAAPLALDDRTRAEAAGFVRRLHALVAARDLAGLEAAAAVVFDEVAPAYGRAPAEGRGEFRRRYGELFARPDFEPAPLDPAGPAFRPCGPANNLLRVTARNGQPVFRERDYDAAGGWFLPLVIGKVGGAWALLR